jgi:hypothetical protein
MSDKCREKVPVGPVGLLVHVGWQLCITHFFCVHAATSMANFIWPFPKILTLPTRSPLLLGLFPNSRQNPLDAAQIVPKSLKTHFPTSLGTNLIISNAFPWKHCAFFKNNLRFVDAMEKFKTDGIFFIG